MVYKHILMVMHRGDDSTVISAPGNALALLDLEALDAGDDADDESSWERRSPHAYCQRDTFLYPSLY